MRHAPFLLIIVLAFLTSSCTTNLGHAKAELSTFKWTETDTKPSGGKVIEFFVSSRSVMAYMEATDRGDTATVKKLDAKLPEDSWIYGVSLAGEATTYPKDKIHVFGVGPCGDPITLNSGNVEIDRNKNTVRIALKILTGDKATDFKANGLYSIQSR